MQQKNSNRNIQQVNLSKMNLHLLFYFSRKEPQEINLLKCIQLEKTTGFKDAQNLQTEDSTLLCAMHDNLPQIPFTASEKWKGVCCAWVGGG